MTYPQVLAYMYSCLPMYQRIGGAAYKTGLGNTLALMDHLNHPHHAFRCIHIAGTNGKGSVSHLLASVFMQAGYKTGLYTSPHLKDYRERIKIDGKQISARYVSRFIQKNKPFFDQCSPSFFEMSVGLAFDYFRDKKVDIAIIETGLGGRLDSTNVIRPEIAVITQIGYDHMGFLGNSLEKIAIEKAGIIKPETPVIIGETQNESRAVFLEKAANEKAPLCFADQEYEANILRDTHPLKPMTVRVRHRKTGSAFLFNLPLKGHYQLKNICTLLAVVEEARNAGYAITSRNLKNGVERVVKQTGLLGRWQILGTSPLVIADTAHNSSGCKETLLQLKQTKAHQTHIVMGVVDDKDLNTLLPLFPEEAIYYFCSPAVPRGMNAGQLQHEALKFGLRGKAYSNVKQAFRAAQKVAKPEDVIYVGGSTFVVAEVV